LEALQVKARLLTQQDRWEEAAAILHGALAQAQAMPYPYAQARLLQVQGRLHLQRGESDLARARLDAALAIFRRLGAHKDVEWVSQAIDSLAQYRSSQPVATTVTDALWAQIQALLQPSRQGPGRPRADDRRILEAILYVRRTGCAWNRIPAELGDAATAHRRWQRWRAEGIWEPMCRILGLPASAADAEGHAPPGTAAQ
jgi:putative transposase